MSGAKHTGVLLSVILVVIAIVLVILLVKMNIEEEPAIRIREPTVPLGTDEVAPIELTPNDFVSKIDNKYLTYIPGMKYIYKGETEEGTERTEVYVTHRTKKVMGIDAMVVWDRVWLEGELIEDTKDWFAQDRYGNVWYLGEDSKDLVDGKVVSTEGSWQAGVDDAIPGIVMKANPKVGDKYRQEYYEGEAEDMGEVVAFEVTVNTKYSTFSDCLQTKDWNPLEPGDEEYKYYCPEVGNLVYEVGIEDGEGQGLIDVKRSTDAKEFASEEEASELKKRITEQEAIAIAQKAVSGTVTGVGIEKKFGKTAYVVEIAAAGGETDVIIDIDTGKVLGIET